MPGQQGIRRSKDCYVRYPKQTYATIPDGLIKICAAKKIGRNGWIVLTTLCKAVYSDGRFARIGSAEQMKLTGLNANQVGRGMKELRDAGIIEAVERTTANPEVVGSNPAPATKISALFRGLFCCICAGQSLKYSDLRSYFYLRISGAQM